MKLRVMDVFSGIGGFSLGLKRAGGFRTVAYCEIDPACRNVLLARMRDGSLDTAPICTDVRRLDGKPWAGRVDLICGGFPCQDLSIAGKKVGIGGARSGLWGEMARLVREIRPDLLFVENVPALRFGGLGRVLGDLASSGYDAEWDCLPASAAGAHHQRDRIWILAYPHRERELQPQGGVQDLRGRACGGGKEMADAMRRGKALGWDSPGVGREQESMERISRGFWAVEPPVGRMAHGIPGRMDRLRGLGNAVVPQVVEWIGRRIMKATSAVRTLTDEKGR